MVTFRSIEPEDHAAILTLVDSLPEWFTDHARNHSIPVDLKHQRGILAELNERVVGFITLFVSEGRLNIGWLGVNKDCQRQGIGSRLIEQAEETASSMGLNELATSTLGESVEYPPYEITRSFYMKHGFKVYQRNKTDNPSCPEEIKISKKIA